MFSIRNLLLSSLLFITLAVSTLSGQMSTYSNDYLTIGVDASGMARGNSVVADIIGVNAGYWNPSGLINQSVPFEISLMHANYFSGLANYDYFGVSYKPGDSLSIGFSLIRFGVDDIPNTLNLIDEDGNVNYDRISYFSVADYAFLFSLAGKTKISGLNWGANLKLIYRRQGEFASAYGFGFDLGAQYHRKNWKFGAVLRDVSSTFNLWIFHKESFEEAYLNTGNEIPENSLELTLPSLITGVAYHYLFNKKISALAEIDLDWFFDGQHHSLISRNPVTIDPHLGIQLSYLKNIFIRAGLNRFQRYLDYEGNSKIKFQVSFGVGIQFFNISVDYALTDPGDISITPVSHIFSIKYALSKH